MAARNTCHGCGAELNAKGHCTRTDSWCTFSDRQQRGALPALQTIGELRDNRSRYGKGIS